MTRPAELGAALALGWSLLLTLGLVTSGILIGALFGVGNLAIVVAGPAELLLMLPAALLLGRLYGDPPRRKALALAPASALELLIGASLGVILHFPTGYMSELIERRFPTPRAVLDAQLHALTPSSALMGALMLLSVAAIVPFAEEVFFRGALFTPLLRSGPSFVAVWTTSIAFAFAHQEPRNWAPLLLVALVLAELRQLGGSIWSGVALHGAFNAATLLMVYVERPTEIKPQAGAWQLALLGGALTVGGLWLFARAAGRRLGAMSTS
ncbi:MAG TPA: CPBP family intramembrane glutamic endopeptidase [Polyangiaceae bacterium]|nr:CPBP family intramembrane glutamic endopeptidase [Polyangiaceae bacterium]